jgi:hypothetical protein
MTLADPAADDRRIACVDLNGVLDSYTGSQGADHFDPPRPGARTFLAGSAARPRSSRCRVHDAVS